MKIKNKIIIIITTLFLFSGNSAKSYEVTLPNFGFICINKINNENQEVLSEKMHLHAKEIEFEFNNNKYFFKASLPNFFKETIKKINIENVNYE